MCIVWTLKEKHRARIMIIICIHSSFTAIIQRQRPAITSKAKLDACNTCYTVFTFTVERLESFVLLLKTIVIVGNFALRNNSTIADFKTWSYNNKIYIYGSHFEGKRAMNFYNKSLFSEQRKFVMTKWKTTQKTIIGMNVFWNSHYIISIWMSSWSLSVLFKSNTKLIFNLCN